MRIELKDFQTERRDDLLAEIVSGQMEFVSRGKPQAISLSAPTGSGKTIILTSAIESIFSGYDDVAPAPGSVFLWISDQPELNEQTRKKMLAVSSALGEARLTTIDSTFDQETLDDGRVYLLNTQKLGRDKQLVSKLGDKRTNTIWNTISNTVRQKGDRFFVVIDEAHRGMLNDSREAEKARTIVQKFIKGSDGEIPPIPLIVGLSATPERFRKLIEGLGAQRTSRPIDISIDEVRSSGLLKDYVRLHNPMNGGIAEITLLRQAARKWQTACVDWASYCETEQEPLVKPIFVVQVEDGGIGKISNTDIPASVSAIMDEVGQLPAEAFAHAFQDGHPIQLPDGRILRYIAPSSINDDPEVKVVFFKSSLTTGWDCPRAEVMMSFRRAVDATLIAQLIGRMIRTPLARRVDNVERLNGVTLHLPRYDERGVAQIVAGLAEPDLEWMTPTPVHMDDDLVDLERNDALLECFSAIEALPSYVIPRASRGSEIKRFMKLARLLANDGIDDNALSAAQSEIVSIFEKQRSAIKASGKFSAEISRISMLEVTFRTYRYGATMLDPGEQMEVLAASKEDLRYTFDAAGKKIGDGLQKIYWKSLVEMGLSPEESRIQATLVINWPGTIEMVQREARRLVQDWMTTHSSSIRAQPESRQHEYREIRRLATVPELSPINLPRSIELRRGKRMWERHLFVDGSGRFPCDFKSTWETKVIEIALRDSATVGWLRNLDRKDWALTVPYTMGGIRKPFYPDFLVIRRVRGEMIVDIIDPHRVDIEDSAPKAVGLADFAARHADAFGKIELILIDKDEVFRLNLCDEEVRVAVLGVQNTQHLRQLYERFGRP